MIAVRPISNGKVWITYPNTIYVWYGDPTEDENGNIRIPIWEITGDPVIKLSIAGMSYGIVRSVILVLTGKTDVIESINF